MPSSRTTIPPWALLSLATNAILLLTVTLLLTRYPTASVNPAPSGSLDARASETSATEASASNTPEEPQLGPRHQWTYEQWVAQLAREAEAIAANPPDRLAILAGDSISLWFPPELLPEELTWLNQGISGEVSSGLLDRLELFDNTNPEVIFLMIGINDLLRGVSPEAILNNYRLIIQDLRWVHPNAKVVVQSILPHRGSQASWEGRAKLSDLPNSQIRDINRELKTIAAVEGAYFLDLYPLFANSEGNLRSELTTDGLHLNDRGYYIWRSALQVFQGLQL